MPAPSLYNLDELNPRQALEHKARGFRGRAATLLKDADGFDDDARGARDVATTMTNRALEFETAAALMTGYAPLPPAEEAK